MAIIKNNPLLRGISGRIGDIVFRTVRGKVHIMNRPKVTRKSPSRQQKTIRTKFQEATQYATRQVAEITTRALYESGITEKKNSAYLVAVSDYLNAPKVNSIGTVEYKGAIGDVIIVKATDDFMVTKVKVVILASDGTQLEEGEAGPDREKINPWIYKTKATNTALAGSTIKAIAFDRPGNVGELSKVL